MNKVIPTGKEITALEESSTDLAAKQWSELVLATIQWQREMKINKNEKLHD
jgi:hypothetical protein